MGQASVRHVSCSKVRNSPGVHHTARRRCVARWSKDEQSVEACGAWKGAPRKRKARVRVGSLCVGSLFFLACRGEVRGEARGDEAGLFARRVTVGR